MNIFPSNDTLRGKVNNDISDRDPLGLFELSSNEFEVKLKNLSFYSILQLSVTASTEDIVRNHRRIAACYHPEKQSNLRFSTKECLLLIITKLNEAKLTLLDKESRSRYDSQLYDQHGSFEEAAVDLNNLRLSGAESFSTSWRLKYRTKVDELSTIGSIVISDNSDAVWDSIFSKILTQDTSPWLAEAMSGIEDQNPESCDFSADISNSHTDLKRTISAISNEPSGSHDRLLRLFTQRLSAAELNVLFAATSISSPHNRCFLYNDTAMGPFASLLERYEEDPGDRSLGYWAQPLLFIRELFHFKTGFLLECVSDIESAVLAHYSDESVALAAKLIHQHQLLSHSLVAFLDQMEGDVRGGFVLDKEDYGDEEMKGEPKVTPPECLKIRKNCFKDRLSSSLLHGMLRRCEEGATAKAESDLFEAAMDYLDLIPAQTGTREVIQCLLIAAALLTKKALLESTVTVKLSVRSLVVELLSTTVGLSAQVTESYIQLYCVKHCWAIQVLLAVDLAEEEGRSKAHSGSGLMAYPVKYFNLWSEDDERLALTCAALAVTVGRAYPLSAAFGHNLVRPSDILYHTLVLGRELQNTLLKYSEESGESETDLLQPAHVAVVLRVEAVWKGWFPEQDFLAVKSRAQEVVAEAQDWDIGLVSDTLSWKFLQRDKDGFLLIPRAGNKIYLQMGQVTSGIFWDTMPKGVYSAVVGCEISLGTGVVNLWTKKPTKTSEFMLTELDLNDVFSGGIGEAHFTLENPRGQFNAHPFQEMRCYPKEALQGTDFLMTLLHADYLLKFLSVGLETSAHFPFNTRTTAAGILRRLPPHLAFACRPVCVRETTVSERSKFPFSNAHRFWIEPLGEVKVQQHISTDDSVMSVSVDRPKMCVKCQKLKKDENGEIVDDTSAAESESKPEFEFAKDLTQHYDELAIYFPELARLQELARLCVIYRLIASVRMTTEMRLKEPRSERVNKWSAMVNNIKIQLSSGPMGRPPLNTPANRDAQYRDILAQNNVFDRDVPNAERNKVQGQIRSNLEKADSQQIKTLVSSLCSNFHQARSKDDVTTKIKSWYNNNTTDSSFVQTLVDAEERDLNAVIAEMESRRIRTPQEPSEEEKQGGILKAPDSLYYCSWVPSVFLDRDNFNSEDFEYLKPPKPPSVKKNRSNEEEKREEENKPRDPSQVYGGVSLATRINVTQCSRPPSAPNGSTKTNFRASGNNSGGRGGSGGNNGGSGSTGGSGGRRGGGVVGGGGNKGGGGTGGGNNGGGGNSGGGGKKPFVSPYRPVDGRTGNTPGPRNTVYPDPNRSRFGYSRQDYKNYHTWVENNPKVKEKLVGDLKVQHTGSRKGKDGGHAVEATRYIYRAAKDPAVKKVATNTSYRVLIEKVTGEKLPFTKGNKVGLGRPDAFAVREGPNGGKIITCVEVPSNSTTDKPAKLFEKFKSQVRDIQSNLKQSDIKFEFAIQQQTRGDRGKINTGNIRDRINKENK